MQALRHMRSALKSIFWLMVLLIVVVLPATPALAIADPDTLSLDSVYVYRHCLENNDQLYLGEYTCDYSSNPAENITQAFICRLMNGSTELGAVAPYTYFDDGYDQGIFAIYFSSADAPSWSGSYTMKIEGNPALSWSGDPPSASTSTFDSWSSSTSIAETQNELASRILYLADKLELAWSVNLIETEGGASYLASAGETYFVNSIEFLQLMAPGAFSGLQIDPDWETRDFSQTYANQLANSVTSTPLDVGDVGDDFGISQMWTSSILYMVGAGVALFFVARWTGSLKPVSLLLIPIIVVGALIGMIPLVAAVITGFLAVAITVFVLFYSPSGA